MTVINAHLVMSFFANSASTGLFLKYFFVFTQTYPVVIAQSVVFNLLRIAFYPLFRGFVCTTGVFKSVSFSVIVTATFTPGMKSI